MVKISEEVNIFIGTVPLCQFLFILLYRYKDKLIHIVWEISKAQCVQTPVHLPFNKHFEFIKPNIKEMKSTHKMIYRKKSKKNHTKQNLCII